MTNTEVIGLGALNIDHIYRVECLLEDGEAVVDEAQPSISKMGARQGLPASTELAQRYQELYSAQL